MLKNFLLFFASFTLASIILIISVFKIAEVKYVFSQSPSSTPVNMPKPVAVNYNLPYPGPILPDSILWPLKALRDKIWLAVTINPSKKADLYLLIADKRLADAQILFEKNNPNLGISVLTKAEKYLESANEEERIAHREGMDTTECLEKFASATLKHREVIDEILALAPEDAKPLIVKTQDYSKHLYEKAKSGLLEAGAIVPQNPFGQN